MLRSYLALHQCLEITFQFMYYNLNNEETFNESAIEAYIQYINI